MSCNNLQDVQKLDTLVGIYFFDCLYRDNLMMIDSEFKALAKISMDYATKRLGVDVDDWRDMRVNEVTTPLDLVKVLCGLTNTLLSTNETMYKDISISYLKLVDKKWFLLPDIPKEAQRAMRLLRVGKL